MSIESKLNGLKRRLEERRNSIRALSEAMVADRLELNRQLPLSFEVQREILAYERADHYLEVNRANCK